VKEIKKLVVLAALLGLSFVLARYQFPFPLAPFLKFDLSETPLMLIPFMGPVETLLALVAYAGIVLTIYGGIGALFKIAAVTTTIIGILIGSLIATNKQLRIVGGLTLGVILRIIVMTGVNYILIIHIGVWDKNALPAAYFSFILPIFNLLQGGINAIATYVVLRYLPEDLLP